MYIRRLDSFRTYFTVLKISVIALIAVPLFGQEVQKEKFQGHDVVSGEVIVRFRATNALQSEVRALSVMSEDADIQSSELLGNSGAIRLRSGRRNVAELMQAYSARADVQYVEPNRIWRASDFPNDTFINTQWGLVNTGQTIKSQAGTPGADIKAVAAWNITTGSRSIVVGVVDSGIDASHPDLTANMWSAPSAFSVTISGTTINCAAGTHGFDAIARSCNASFSTDGHGTHVAGIIGGTGNNGFGMSGVSPVAQLMDLRFLNTSGEGSTANAIAAIDFAIQVKARFGASANIRILNASWGSETFSQALLDEINLAAANNMLFVAAAGNETTNSDVTPSYPAAYNGSNIIAVAATDNSDRLASFSNFGLTSIDVGAPGVNIFSTLPHGNDQFSEVFDFKSGTSMATPMVSGAAALVLSGCPELSTPLQLRDTLLAPASIDLLPALTGKVSTGGRINVLKALNTCGAVAPNSDFQLTAASGFPIVAVGGTTSASVILSSIGSFSNNVTLTVSSPSGISATLANSTLNFQSPNTILSISIGSAVAPGTYLIVVTGSAGVLSRTSGFALTVLRLGSIAGSNDLTTSSQRQPDSIETFYALYAFAVNSRTVSIDVSSNDFDTRLFLMRSDGALVDSDLGGGVGFTSHVGGTLSPGTYFLKVTSVLPGATGGYSMSSDLLYLSSISPTSLNRNKTVNFQLTGNRFSPGMSINAGSGITAGSVSFSSSTSASVSLTPDSTAALGEHTLFLLDALGGSNSISFTVLGDLPVITSVTPSEFLIATTADISITGSNFLTPLSVFASYAGGFVIPVSNVVVQDSSHITATVIIPGKFPQFGTVIPDMFVRVASPFGSSNSIVLTLKPPPPVITDILTSGVFQGVSQFVQFVGTNLYQPTVNAGPDSSTSPVFGQTEPTVFQTYIQMGAGAVTGPRSVTLTTKGGTSNSLPLNVFAALPPPTLTSLTPSSGHRGDHALATFRGTNFAGSVNANFSGGISLCCGTIVDSTTYTVEMTIDSNATFGIHNVTLTTFFGTSAPVPFTVISPPMTLTGFSPGTVGRGKTVNAILNGTFLVAPLSFSLTGTGVSISNVVVNSLTSATAILTVDPSAPLGQRTLTVTSGGTSGNAVFSVIAPPSVTSISPAEGTWGSTSNFTFAGSDFQPFMTFDLGPGITAIAANIVNSGLAIASLTIAPGAAAGPRNVTVSTPGGTSTPIAFQVNALPPTFTAISPPAGKRGSAVTVSLTGTNFFAPLTLSAGPDITVGNISINSSTSATALLIISPKASLGSRSVLVTNSAGNSSALSFTVLASEQQDFSADAKADLLWYNAAANQTAAWLMDGINVNSYASLTADPNLKVTAVADLNGDGKSDLLWFNSATNQTIAWLMNGTTVLGTATLLTDANWKVVATADLNGDGKSDLIWSHGTSGQKSAWLMNGTGVLSFASLSSDANLKVAATGDLNGDGKADLIWSNAATGQTSAWLMNGTAILSSASLLTEANWKVTAVSDLNGDSKSDLIWYNAMTGETSVWLMNGLNISTFSSLLQDPNWKVLGPADLNGDGNWDLIWYNPVTSQTSASLMTGVSVISSGLLLGAPNWKVISISDLDADGKSDLVWYNAATGETSAWLMDGMNVSTFASLFADANWKVLSISLGKTTNSP